MTKGIQTVSLVGAVALSIAVGACSEAGPPQESAPPKPVVRITQLTFEPVYRASKSLQGATTSGVTYAKFGELAQTFATEIGIAKDHQLTTADQKLVSVYEKAFGAYQASAGFWKANIEQGSAQDRLKGRILICTKNTCAENALGILAEKYSIALEPLEPKTTIMVAPAGTVQQLWKQADAFLLEATEIYYGRREP